jgi:hypothetical protein
MLQVRQGFASLSAPTKELLRLVLDRKLRHGAPPGASLIRVQPGAEVRPGRQRQAGQGALGATHRPDPGAHLRGRRLDASRAGGEARERL